MPYVTPSEDEILFRDRLTSLGYTPSEVHVVYSSPGNWTVYALVPIESEEIQLSYNRIRNQQSSTMAVILKNKNWDLAFVEVIANEDSAIKRYLGGVSARIVGELEDLAGEIEASESVKLLVDN